MDIEKLKELKSWVSDLRKFGVSEGNEIIELIDEAIARPSVTSEAVQEAIGLLAGKSYGTHNLSCDCVFCTALDLAVAALQAYQPWVSVSDRLPDDGIPVLVTYLGFCDGKPHSDGVARWSIEENAYDGGWLWEIDRSEVTVEITHWKPVPEPPKGETP